MIMGTTEEEEKILNINSEAEEKFVFQKVDEFVYLGALIQKNGKAEQEIKARLTKGNKSRL